MEVFDDFNYIPKQLDYHILNYHKKKRLSAVPLDKIWDQMTISEMGRYQLK